MKHLGVDTAARISAAQAQILRYNGVSFVGRYLVPQTMSKALTEKETKALRDNKIAILLCWELEENAVRQGADRGATDGKRARECAEALGVPAGTTIYFACDYNIPQADLIIAEQYVKAAQAALGGVYEAGMYGPFALVDFLSSRGSCRKFWQCVAWSPRFLPEAQTWQYQWQGSPESKAMAEKVGFDVDMDTCDDLRGAGLWMPYNEYADGDGTVIEPTKPTKEPWYAEQMKWAEDAGLMMDGRPNDKITRAEAATLLKRYDARVKKMIDEAIKLRMREDDSFGGLIN
jgi:hypothetical protein